MRAGELWSKRREAGLQKLSAIVTCKNEEANIGDCLRSISWADEIVVVDSFSTDRTAEIARSLGAKVLQHEYESPGSQKNWAIERTAHPWLLFLDADERATSALAAEIRDILLRDGPRDGYWIRRRNYFLGKEVRYSGWQHDRVLRLFRRGRGRWEERRVHESLLLDGSAGRLRQPLVHYSYRSVDDWLMKVGRYGEWAAADMLAGGKRAGLRGLLLNPWFDFLYKYLGKRGFMDGKHGLVICMFQAFAVFYKNARLWEMRLREKQAGE